MQKTDAELTTEAQVIRDETTALANTKLRVYNILKNIVDSKVNNADAASSVWGDITGTITDQADLVTYIATQLAALVDSSPATLDTLNELAAALGDDPNFATTVTTALGLKAPLASPALTGTPTVPTAAPGTNNTQAASTAYADAKVADAINNGTTAIAPSQNAVFDALALKADKSARTQGFALSDDFTPVTAGAAKLTFHFPYTTTISLIWIELKTAQASGSVFTVDVNVNGSTILSTKLTIDNTEETSLTATIPAVISSASITKGDKVTVDVDQVGNGTGIGLKIWFEG